jgi:hypothetical protein
MFGLNRVFAAGALLLSLAACGTTEFRTYYEPVSQAARGWRVADVQVTVPASLSVSEAATFAPEADIVWREDPPGDRRAQVDAIMTDAVRRGAAGLRGGTPVRLLIEVQRFHALTFEAERGLNNSGVHNIDFLATIVDARSGAVIYGPAQIEAATPAFAGAEAIIRRGNGETQKSVISRHIAATIAGWLGAGPDNRREFSRRGL